MSTDSESVSIPFNIEKCSLVLVDVAGTTTSIDFVKETLFNFVNTKVEAFLKEKWEETAVKDCIKKIKEEDAEITLEAATERVKKLTEENSTNEGLKNLQGLIYQQGYESGDLKAHIFDDVAESFEAWAKNRQIAIYSTGSIESQKLLFTNTISGDISTHISKFFDQSVGLKTEAESYKTIAKEMGIAVEEVVFITDDPKEATAAKEASLVPVLIKRGDVEIDEEARKNFTVISSFKELNFDKAPKRKIEEETATEEAPPAKVAKTEESLEKVAEKSESMEIDVPETKTEEQNGKTETDEKTVEVKEAVEEKMEAESVETKTEEAKEVKPEEAKMEVEKSVEAEKTEIVEEVKTDETEKKTEEKPTVLEETKPVEQAEVTEKTIEETKAEEIKTDETKTAVEEAASVENKTNGESEPQTTTTTEETKPEAEIKTTEETKQVEDVETKEEPKPAAEETKEEKPKAAIDETKPTEEESRIGEETKTSQEGNKVEEEIKTVDAEEEKKVVDESKIETKEKENKSELANGVENGKEETAIEKNGVESPAEVETAEVAVKKLEETAGSTPVSVEV